jgi:hypothetical protein
MRCKKTMIKEIYLIHGKEDESYADFSARILHIAKSQSENPSVSGVKVVLTLEAPPHFSVIPFRKNKIASLSLYRQSSDGPVKDLQQEQGFTGAYRVTEELPVHYQKTWPDGQTTPGACLLTLFNRKKGLDYATFIQRWHYSHTPLSLKIHPLWNYSRNVVEEILSQNSTPFEGIVEEQMREDRDLINPFRFFGNPLIILPRMLSVYRDTKSFIDYSGIETYFAREIVFKTEG